MSISSDGARLVGCGFMLALAVSGTAVAAAPLDDCERFDLSGLPAKPTRFPEQQILALVVIVPR